MTDLVSKINEFIKKEATLVNLNGQTVFVSPEKGSAVLMYAFDNDFDYVIKINKGVKNESTKHSIT